MTITMIGRAYSPANQAPAGTPSAITSPQIADSRSIEMYLINEELARAQIAQRQREAERIRLARRIAVARRAERKAAHAQLRARIAVLAVI